jgi:hypothetical protein
MPSPNRAIQPILLEVYNTRVYGHEHSVNWEVPQKMCGKLKCINNEKLEAQLLENEACGRVCVGMLSCKSVVVYNNVPPMTGCVLCFTVVL